MSAVEFLPMHSAAVMASPIRWLHLPKAGQSFIFTVLLYGCRNNATLVDVVHSFLDGIANTPRKLQYAVRQFHLMQSPDRCPLLNPPVGSRMVVGHAHLGRTDNNVVGLFRQPRQRMLSYCAGGDDFPSCVRASAQSHLGVAVHQIGGERSIGNNARPYPDPSRAACKLALWRMVHRFAFVGLQEDWQASVELFHKTMMPSVPIEPAESANIHATKKGGGSSSTALKSLLGRDAPRSRCQQEQQLRYSETVFDAHLDGELHARLALDPDQIVYALARLLFCSRSMSTFPERVPSSCRRTCPIVYLQPLPRGSTLVQSDRQHEQHVDDAAARLLRHWAFEVTTVGLEPAPLLLRASLRGDSLHDLASDTAQTMGNWLNGFVARN